MKEALLYEKKPDGSVRCDVCCHRCLIHPGFRGLCGVRQNINGTLFSLAYGKTISAAIDPIEKKPLYHFLPHSRVYSFATEGCNFKCPWCQNWDISQASKTAQPLAGEAITPLEHVEWALIKNCPSIAYTYNEPTVFLEYALDTMKEARLKGLKNIWVTNGYMTPEALELILPYLDAANVDYKTPNDGTYERYCGAHGQPILDNIKTMIARGVHVEITTLLVPGVNDKEAQIREMVQEIKDAAGTETPWHISRFFPAWHMETTPITPLRTLELAKKIGTEAGFRLIHIGNV